MIELRIPIENPSRNELVEDPDHQRRKDGEKDVIERQRPRFVCDLSGKVVEEGELNIQLVKGYPQQPTNADPELCHIQDDVLIERD